jgi:hypothetical protein
MPHPESLRDCGETLNSLLKRGVQGIIMLLEWDWERDQMLSIKSDINSKPFSLIEILIRIREV